MRIERIEVDGFGRFSDAHWELAEGMTILLGANEAGKTTLLNAIRALLFGFESTRDGRTWYPAFAGGRRGGRLVLRLQSGERWTVDRHGDRGGAGALIVEAPNGNRGGQEQLNALLGGADRDLFNNIFAFGLGELEAFSSLSSEGVSSRIYGAGSGLGGSSVLDLERRLRTDQEAAYKARGQEQTLTRLLSRIEEVRGRIAELEQQPAEYQAAVTELAGLRDRHAELRSARTTAAEQRERLRRVLEAQGPATRLTALELELSQGDAGGDELPGDAEAVLDRLLASLHEAEAALASLDESIVTAERRRAALAVDEAILSEVAEINALRDERLIQEQRAAQHEQADAAAARLGGELTDQLRRVGGWSEDRLLAVDDSLATIEATRELERRLVSTRAALESLQQRTETGRAAVDAAGNELDEDDLDDREISARRAALSELDDLRVTSATLDERARLTHGDVRPDRSWLPALVTLGVLLLVGSLVGSYLAFPVHGMVVGLLLGLTAAAVMLVRPVAGPPVRDLDDERRVIATRRRELLARAGVDSDADSETVSAAADDLAAKRAGLRAASQQKVRLAERREALQRLERECDAARSEQDAAVAAWRGFLAQRELPENLSPEAARQVLAVVTAARRLTGERDEQLQRLSAIADAASAFDDRLDALLARLGRPIPDQATLRPSTVVALADEVQRAGSDRRHAEELDESLREQRGRREPLAAAIEAARVALAGHLAQCNLSSADELRRLAAVAAARRARRQEVREVRATLIALAGNEDALGGLVDEARANDPASLEARREEAAAAVTRLEAEESETLTREGGLSTRIAQLETAEELGARRQELALLQARADAESRRWAVRAVALALLGETRRRYERERQPQVVRDAERYFATITDGRYARIVAPPGEGDVRVEPLTGTSRTTDQLSRGTAEQLYLALRFGLIEQFGRTTEPLPVVMDDILVNFDRDRAARAAGAIRELATRHQVIFFTCHPQTAELLDPDGVVTLSLD